MSVDLGSGSNKLTLGNAGNTGTVSNIVTLISGTGVDAITLGTAAANASIDLGAGSDTLAFGNFTNAATVANTETIIGGTGNDTITLGSALTNSMSVDLGTGSNKLTLGNFTNTGTVSAIGTLIGGTGADTITLGTAATNGSVDLGGSNDTLHLGDTTNSISVTNTASVMGGSGADTIVLTGSNASLVDGGGGLNFITGNVGANEFVFDQDSAGNTSKIKNFNSGKGDTIALDTTGSGILGGNTYNVGSGGLTPNDLTSVADNTALLATTLTNGGKGQFAYELDTGGLYYSSNGVFSGGGTLVGTVTTDGTTPWTFDATKFVQV